VKEEDQRGSVSSDFDTKDPASRFTAQMDGDTTPESQVWKGLKDKKL
jgi:hypothetical protein